MNLCVAWCHVHKQGNKKMKKLLAFVAVLGTAFSLHAASFIWCFGSSDYTDTNGNFMDYGTAFLYLGDVTASSTAFDASAATLLATSAFDATYYMYGNMDTDALSTSDALKTTDSDQAYTLILVDKSVQTLDGYEGNYYLASGLSEQESVPGATVTYFAKFENYDSITQSDWQTMAVPEPTSGLLMLLGMAGLALKRKRA